MFQKYLKITGLIKYSFVYFIIIPNVLKNLGLQRFLI